MIDLPCPESDWPRFTVLLDVALELPDTHRDRWLDDLAGDDARLKPWLARVLGNPPNMDMANVLCPPDLNQSVFCVGDRVGPYRLESLLGEGGMGEVWRASRGDDGPRRQVALKLPHPAFLGGTAQARFARERDVLAALSHPHTAQLYDAGLGADGHPYLALELVEGVPITDRARAQEASLEQRVDLVRQMLAGLSYAHQRLIVHRDIKPANVLVTPAGDVKLLDFGIAKLLGGQTDTDAVLTGVIRLATPAYAAPEQLRGDPIGVAADIFSVGVLLFELCVGHRPFPRVPADSNADAAPLASRGADAALAGLPDRTGFARSLRGDLDAIIAKAVALAPADRYASAEAFDDDLRRWRADLPVRARRVGWPDLAAKFVRRNKLGVALTGLLSLSLVGGTAATAWQAHRAKQQAHRAEQEAARATAVKNFLFGLLDTGSPQAGGQRSDSITLRTLLDVGADRIEAAFAGDPVTEIDVLENFGGIFDEIEEDDRAERVYTRRLEIARRLYGGADPRVLNAALDLSEFESHALDFGKAQAVLEAIRLPILGSFGPDSVFRGAWLQVRAESLRATEGGRVEIVADLKGVIAIFSRHPLEHGPTLGTVAYSNALLMLQRAQLDADQFGEALTTVRQMGAMTALANPGSATAEMQYRTALGVSLEKAGKLDAADAIYAAAQAQAEHVIGKHGGWYLNPLMHRVTLADLRGQSRRADALFHTPGVDLVHKSSLPARTRGAMLARDGRGAEAAALLEPALAQARKNARDEDTVRVTEGVLGDAYDQVGRSVEARELLLAARNRWSRFGVPGATATFAAMERWGRFLLEHDELAAAAAEFRAVLTQAGGRPSAPLSLVTADLARIALIDGDVREADRQSSHAVELLDSVTVEYDVRDRIEIWAARADSLLALGQLSAAQAWAQKAAGAANQYCAPGSVYPRRAAALLARITAQHGP